MCSDFAATGYCPRGGECSARHVFECPEFAETGTCSKKKCRLPHIDTASTVRKRGERERVGHEDDVDYDNEGEEIDNEDDDDGEDDDEGSSDVESEGYIDDGQRFEDQLDFMHL